MILAISQGALEDDDRQMLRDLDWGPRWYHSTDQLSAPRMSIRTSERSRSRLKRPLAGRNKC
jgi:hypothetical protein